MKKKLFLALILMLPLSLNSATTTTAAKPILTLSPQQQDYANRLAAGRPIQRYIAESVSKVAPSNYAALEKAVNNAMKVGTLAKIIAGSDERVLDQRRVAVIKCFVNLNPNALTTEVTKIVSDALSKINNPHVMDEVLSEVTVALKDKTAPLDQQSLKNLKAGIAVASM